MGLTPSWGELLSLLTRTRRYPSFEPTFQRNSAGRGLRPLPGTSRSPHGPATPPPAPVRPADAGRARDPCRECHLRPGEPRDPRRRGRGTATGVHLDPGGPLPLWTAPALRGHPPVDRALPPARAPLLAPPLPQGARPSGRCSSPSLRGCLPGRGVAVDPAHLPDRLHPVHHPAVGALHHRGGILRRGTSQGTPAVNVAVLLVGTCSPRGSGRPGPRCS